MTGSVLTVQDKLLSNIVIDDEGCWLWQGFLNKGYGKIVIGGVQWMVHRCSYATFVGEISPEMEIDHKCHRDSECAPGICKHRSCINPEHLQEVDGTTHRKLTIRLQDRDFCNNGHPVTSDSLYINDTVVWCRPCRTESVKRHRQGGVLI